MNIKSKLIILYIVLLIISLIQFLSINLLAQDITINVTAEENENSGSSVVIFDQQDFEESQKTTLFEFLQSQSFLYIAEGIDEA